MTQLNPSNKGIIRYFGSNRDLVMTPVVQAMYNPVYVANEARFDHSEGSDDPESQSDHHPFYLGEHGAEFFAEMTFDSNKNQGKAWNLKASVLGSVKNTTVDPTSNVLKIRFHVFNKADPAVEIRTVDCDGEIYYNGQEQWLFQGKAIIPFLPNDYIGTMFCGILISVEHGFGAGINQHALLLTNMSIEYEIERVD